MTTSEPFKPIIISQEAYGSYKSEFPSAFQNYTITERTEIWGKANYLTVAEQSYLLYADSANSDLLTVDVMDMVLKIYSYYNILIPSYAVYYLEVGGKMTKWILFNLSGLSPVSYKDEKLIRAMNKWFDIDFFLGLVHPANYKSYLSSKLDSNGDVIRIPLGCISLYWNKHDIITSDQDFPLMERAYRELFRYYLPDESNALDIVSSIEAHLLGLKPPDFLQFTTTCSELIKNLCSQLVINYEYATNMMILLICLKPHYIELGPTTGLTQEQANEVIFKRRDYAKKVYSCSINHLKSHNFSDSFVLTIRSLWYRHCGAEITQNNPFALKDLFQSHTDVNGNINLNECRKTFERALRYIILNPSVRHLVKNGYVMIFANSAAGSAQVDKAVANGIKYPAVLRFRSNFRDHADAPSLQLTLPLSTKDGKSTRSHIGFIVRDNGRIHTFDKDSKIIDPLLIKDSIHDWFDILTDTQDQTVDYTLVNTKGKFIYIKNFIHCTNPAVYIPAHEPVSVAV